MKVRDYSGEKIIMGKYSIGIDLGGTKIIAGVVNKETGEVVGHAKKHTKKEKGSDIVIQRVFETVEKAICIAGVPINQIDSIGIGAAGQVDRENGVLIASPNLNCFDLELKRILEEHFNMPVKVGNDVEVATLGEMKFGNGVGYNNFLCVFVGTGIGSGIVINGQLMRGANGTAGEIGHMTVDGGGRPCECGAYGCLEAYASRTAIEKRIKAELRRGESSLITSILKEDDYANGTIRSSHMKKALEQGDELVLACINEASDYLSSGLSSVINFLNPEAIVLGGGLVDSIDYFYDIIVKKTKKKALPTAVSSLKITKAKLGDFSGVVGAALL